MSASARCGDQRADGRHRAGARRRPDRRAGARPCRAAGSAFRVPLYPLPPLVALAGWLFLFASTGASAIAFGIGTVSAGAIVYLVRARRDPSVAVRRRRCARDRARCARGAAARRDGSAAALRTVARAVIRTCEDRALRAAASTIVEVDGKPFFFLGGAFFYERIPRSRWRDAMMVMRADRREHARPVRPLELARDRGRRVRLRRPHEPAPRSARGVAARKGSSASTSSFARVRSSATSGATAGIRHGCCSGRSTACRCTTCSRAAIPRRRRCRTRTLTRRPRSGCAIATHLRYASRWLHRALEEFRPVADRVIAVQLDDDQGAYLDNDTYPAPHLHRYLHWLESQVREVIGPRTPVFINTFEMKVPDVVAGVGDGQLVPERRVRDRRARPRRARVRDGVAAHAAPRAARVQRVPGRLARGARGSRAASRRSDEHERSRWAS